MKIPKGLGIVVLSIWLMLRGFVALISLSFAGMNIVLGVLAIAAGLLVLLGLKGDSLSSPRKLGLLCLGIWLLLTGLLSLVSLGLGGLDIVLAVLAIAAGGLLLFAILRNSPLGELGRLFLAAWLLLTGLVSLIGLSFPAQTAVLGVLALIGGILLLVGR